MTKPPVLTTLLAAVAFAATLAGCSSQPPLSADVKDSVRAALDAQGLKTVSVAQDREKGVVTLSGKVPTDGDKSAAAGIAQRIAVGQVVANEVTVEPAGMEADARQVRDALDDGIDSNIKALLIGVKGVDDVKYDVKTGVVTLTGTVSSQAKRTEVEKAAKNVANVKQVVNELQVTNQKATGRGGV